LGDINRQIYGFSTSTQWQSNVANSVINQIQWELGYRIDYNKTKQIYDANYYDENQEDYIITNLDSSSNETIRSFKVGINVQGKKSLLNYNLYLNQGRSKRLPTPNDLILFNHSQLQSSLLLESLLSTEVGFNVAQDSFPSESPLSKFKISGSVFINNYSDKIAYEYYQDIPPAPYNVDLSRISGFEIGFNTSLWGEILNLKIGYQKLNLDNPIIYPNKPDSRFTIHCDIGYKWLFIGYDHFFDGNKFVVYNGFVSNSYQGEENANLSIIIKKKIWRVNASIHYVIHNLYSTEPVLADPEVHSISPYDFFDIHREIIKIKLSI
jgi:hypothetical protein